MRSLPTRRDFLHASSLFAVLSALPFPAFAQGSVQLKIGIIGSGILKRPNPANGLISCPG